MTPSSHHQIHPTPGFQMTPHSGSLKLGQYIRRAIDDGGMHWLVDLVLGAKHIHTCFICERRVAFCALSCSKEPGQQRVKRWAFGIDEVLKDPVGREQFLKFLESEFSSENLRYMRKNTRRGLAQISFGSLQGNPVLSGSSHDSSIKTSPTSD